MENFKEIYKPVGRPSHIKMNKINDNYNEHRELELVEHCYNDYCGNREIVLRYEEVYKWVLDEMSISYEEEDIDFTKYDYVKYGNTDELFYLFMNGIIKGSSHVFWEERHNIQLRELVAIIKEVVMCLYRYD